MSSRILGLSERTVHNHVENAKRRLQVATRMQAVMHALAGQQISLGDVVRRDARAPNAAAERLARLGAQCVQISVDGATAATHERVRPGSSFDAAIGAIRRLVSRGIAPQLVFVPTRWNIAEAVAT